MRVSLRISDPSLRSSVVGILDLLGPAVRILEDAAGRPTGEGGAADVTITDQASGAVGERPEGPGGRQGSRLGSDPARLLQPSGMVPGLPGSLGDSAGHPYETGCTKVIRLGVDVRIPGEEVEFLRLVEAARTKSAHPIAVFAGASGGVGTTALCVEVAKRWACKHEWLHDSHLFVLNLVDDPTLGLGLTRFDPATLLLDWDDIDLGGDLLTLRIPAGLLVVSGTVQVAPPELHQVSKLARALSKVGPVFIDSGRMNAQTVPFCAGVGASIVLVGNKNSKAMQYAQLRTEGELPPESIHAVHCGKLMRARRAKQLVARIEAEGTGVEGAGVENVGTKRANPESTGTKQVNVKGTGATDAVKDAGVNGVGAWWKIMEGMRA